MDYTRKYCSTDTRIDTSTVVWSRMYVAFFPIVTLNDASKAHSSETVPLRAPNLSPCQV